MANYNGFVANVDAKITLRVPMSVLVSSLDYIDKVVLDIVSQMEFPGRVIDFSAETNQTAKAIIIDHPRWRAEEEIKIVGEIWAKDNHPSISKNRHIDSVAILPIGVGETLAVEFNMPDIGDGRKDLHFISDIYENVSGLRPFRICLHYYAAQYSAENDEELPGATIGGAKIRDESYVVEMRAAA